MRRKMFKPRDQSFFRRNSQETKSINLGRITYRGGIRF